MSKHSLIDLHAMAHGLDASVVSATHDVPFYLKYGYQDASSPFIWHSGVARLFHWGVGASGGKDLRGKYTMEPIDST